tara:strand:+ start:790 stop:1632 length:843 start_codon:yes stop_codon:yes gene_type:complete
MFHYKSPAKLNLFLKVLNKRVDGFHNIQSIFQLIDFYDYLSFEKRKDNKVKITCNVKNLEVNNIIEIAIELFRKKFNIKKYGLNIKLKKNIPIGAGLGGGSSNAATTLTALSKIWNIKTTSKSLFELGLELGSDVPFFLNGMNAWIEGRGEVITNIYLRPKWYLLIFSSQFISTKEIYELASTANDEKKYDFDDFINDRIQNDFEKIVLKKHPSIAKTKKWLSKYGKSRMTGTGGTFFIDFESAEKAERVLLAIVENKPPSIPKNYKAIIVKSHNNDNID